MLFERFLFSLFFSPTSTPSFFERKKKKHSNKMAARPVLKTALLALLLCASAMVLMLSGPSSFADAATSKRAKRAKAEARQRRRAELAGMSREALVEGVYDLVPKTLTEPENEIQIGLEGD